MYDEALDSLQNIMNIEAKIRASRLDMAMTHLNMSTIFHFTEEFNQAINHVNCAKDILVGEINQLLLRGKQIDQQYKKKLYLNLVLAYFNRAVEYEQLEDHKQASKNFN